jgi:hypothetical protein
LPAEVNGDPAEQRLRVGQVGNGTERHGHLLPTRGRPARPSRQEHRQDWCTT